MPAFAAVSTSIDESPIIRASSGKVFVFVSSLRGTLRIGLLGRETVSTVDVYEELAEA